MKWIIFSHPNNVEEEVKKIVSLFEEGLEILHLRKPGWSLLQMEALLRLIPFQYYKRIVIHDHVKLCEKYNVKGIHLSNVQQAKLGEIKVKAIIKTFQYRGLTVSASFHSFNEIESNSLKFNYGFLSPLFDSISKRGYKSNWTLEELKSFMNSYSGATKVIGLGGIDERTIQLLKGVSLDGVGLLGVIWELGNSPVEQFKIIKNLSL